MVGFSFEHVKIMIYDSLYRFCEMDFLHSDLSMKNREKKPSKNSQGFYIEARLAVGVRGGQCSGKNIQARVWEPCIWLTVDV